MGLNWARVREKARLCASKVRMGKNVNNSAKSKGEGEGVDILTNQKIIKLAKRRKNKGFDPFENRFNYECRSFFVYDWFG